ncbi:hypothetical protein NFI96_032271 [Prochilodus magdalenae]|nr:hypothetical protein NFI96_032271 [Prochilodus magdalenae]
MKDLIEKVDVEEVHDDGAILVKHGIYLTMVFIIPKSQKSLRVVFDCSAKYKGTSLNEPSSACPHDMINNLTGVLMSFPGTSHCTDFSTFKVVPKDQPATRRSILSSVASIYDPLGFVAPYLLNGKRNSPGNVSPSVLVGTTPLTRPAEATAGEMAKGG